MVVKMGVGPIAELTEVACSGPSCALLRHRRGATNETAVLLGPRASSRQLLPQNAMECPGSCGHTRSLGALQDHPEPARSIGQDRNHHGKKEITTSGAFLKTTETPAGSRDVDPRWRLCGELCQHVFGSLSQRSTPPRSESAQTAGPARPQTAPTTKD
jgi:hypothetical protein